MDRRWEGVLTVSLCLLVLGASACTDKGSPATTAATSQATLPDTMTRQTTCPVMGGKIDKSLYVDHDGKRIYACCAGCIDAIKKDPAKYIKQLEAQGITLDKAPPALCPKCGEIKGSLKCCKPEGREICPKCGLFKGSPGCCKLPK